MSANEDSSSDDDDDDFNFESSNIVSKRYPVHDCCEYEDAESLRRLINVPRDVSSDNSENNDVDDEDEDSSSDDNDSLAAAHAAAIGHSPNPILFQSENPHDSLDNSRITHLGNDRKSSSWGDDSNGNGTVEHRRKVDSELSKAIELETIDTAVTDGNELAASSLNDKEKSQKSPENDASKEQSCVESSERNLTIESDPLSSLSTLQKMEPAESDKDMDNSTSFPTLSHDNNNDKQKKSPKKKSMNFYSPYDLNERDEDENTPLHVAIHARKLEHVRLLLESGASTARKCDGSYPVHTAISIGGIRKFSDFAHDCVAMLVGYGADLSLKDDAFHTPLYLACEMNLPKVVSFILSDSEGISTLNARSDRLGGRPLHAAAKFDVFTKSGIGFQSTSISESSVIPLETNFMQASRHGHVMSIGGDSSTESATSRPSQGQGAVTLATNNQSRVTQLLLSQNGIEVDAQNMQGHTPLHVACSRGNWPIVRMLLNAEACPKIRDKRGLTPLQLARKRGMPVPNNLLEVLSENILSNTQQPRDLVVDPDNTTFVISHELCMLHRTCPPIRRDSGFDAPPENIRRLHVLVNENDGILRCGEFSQVKWQNSARRAALSDVLKCHEYEYVEKISELCLSIPDHPLAIAHLDADTAVSRWSFESALRAAGSVCEAVDKVVNGDNRNAFCAVRPPGHHAGPRGIVRCTNDPDGGSHGFCLLNNVAIGAAYARNVYRHVGIKKIAIVDFDVHHGNGTEEIIRQLVPTVEKAIVRAPFAVGELASHRYRPWLDETDINDVFFASTHGYGPRGMEFVDIAPQQTGWFYPASGKSHVTDAISNPSAVEKPHLNDFLLSQSWTRMGEESRLNCCKIINCGLGLPGRDTVPGMQRLEIRDCYRKTILPRLKEFEPDIIFISAGFDAHRKDTMNFGYVGMVEEDYEWLTEQIVKVANSCCNGRIISVLEGGYKVQGGIVSPFARSVASHVRALVDGGCSREMYDSKELLWESQFEAHILDERERKRLQKLDRHVKALESAVRHKAAYDGGDDDEERSRKRRRNQVDYKELYQQMKREGANS